MRGLAALASIAALLCWGVWAKIAFGMAADAGSSGGTEPFPAIGCLGITLMGVSLSGLYRLSRDNGAAQRVLVTAIIQLIGALGLLGWAMSAVARI
jgi:hypothetical protein